MAYQATFKRHEVKYIMNPQQKQDVLNAMRPHMKLDDYGRTTIRSIYYDTDNWELIRHSIEKPVYREKLRIRSYKTVGPDDPVFVELKKKYKKVVYKRRLSLPEGQTEECFRTGKPLPVNSQIAEEIEYFRSFYGNLHPAVFLSYEREAFYALDGSDFRVTFDENILYRDYDLSLEKEPYGTPLLGRGQTLMEVKTAGGMPLWMSHELNRIGLFRSRFSKYGLAYKDIMSSNKLTDQRRILNVS
ncbi:MAG: polyphosphate polymerase domain-containing protein [Anaerovoracaceae bacterium]